MDGRRKPSALVALFLATAALAAIGAAVVANRSGDDDDRIAELLDESNQEDILGENPPAAPHRSPGSAESSEAVERFLDAEQEDDWESSFELLSLEDRERYLSAEMWAARRDGVLGNVERWRWDTTPDDETTAVELTPEISLTHGIKPADIVIEWITVDQDGWRVALAQSTIRAELPTPDSAVEVAERWLDADCEQRSATEHFLASYPNLADEACETGALVDGATPTPATGRAAADLAVRFGPDSADLVRTLSLTAPADTSIVLAPISDGWIVIDVLADL